jgi:hypothetical protein
MTAFWKLHPDRPFVVGEAVARDMARKLARKLARGLAGRAYGLGREPVRRT